MSEEFEIKVKPTPIYFVKDFECSEAFYTASYIAANNKVNKIMLDVEKDDIRREAHFYFLLIADAAELLRAIQQIAENGYRVTYLPAEDKVMTTKEIEDELRK